MDNVRPVRAYTRVKKYKSQNSTIGDVYDNEIIPYEFLDNKGVFNSFYVQGYWRGEAYRFGLVVWDRYMKPTFVQWIDDVQMPERYESVDIPDFTNNSDADLSSFTNTFPKQQYLKNLGIRFNNIDLSSLATDLGIAESELPEYISGFSIVRAPRDEQTIAQGLLLAVAEPGSAVTDTNSLFYDKFFPFNFPMTGVTSTPTGLYGPTEQQYVTSESRKYGKLVSPDDLFDFKDRFTNNSDTVPVVDTNTTTLKILGKMRMKPTLLSSGNTYLGGNTNMKSLTLGTSADIMYGLTRYLSRANFNNSKEIPINSIHHFTASSTAFTFDPQNPTRQFRNMLYFNKNWSGLLNNETSDTKCNGGSAGAIINLDAELPDLIGSNPSMAQITYGPSATTGYCYLVNIVDKKTPYGGTSETAKSNTMYISTGHFQPINDAVYTNNGNSWKFDEVEVFGGDCHVGLFDVTTETLNLQNTSADRTDMFSWTDVFAVESNVNVGLREGRHANEDGIMSGVFVGGSGGTFTPAATDPNNLVNKQGVARGHPEAFVYNEAYSELDSNVFYAAAPLYFDAKEKFINRVRYSLAKIANEGIDNFRQFLIDNFKDVDIQNRAINNLRVRGENLYYWQDRAVGYLPINERITVATALGEPTQIGVGGVMTRYDERTDFFGNQHKHGLIETPPGFIWIDRQNRALISMNLSGELAELSAMKGMMSFFDPLIKRTTLDNPIDKASNGVLGIYDARTKNTYISFVGSKSGTLEGTITLIGGGQTLFNVGTITSSNPFYDIITGQVAGNEISVVINGNTYETTLVGGIGGIGPNWSLAINTEIPGAVIGDTAIFTIYLKMEAKTVAINQLSGTFISRYSFTPCAYIRYQDLMLTIPHTSNGDSRNTIWVHDEGDLSKFYDNVFDTDITFIINPNIELPKVFDNIEMNIGQYGPSSVEYSTSFQTGTDLDIPNNNEYRFRNRDWVGTVARDASISGPNGRMRDH